jgi:hypothetical protein
MKRIALHTPIHSNDNNTQTEFDPEKIIGIESVIGDDSRDGTHFFLQGSPKQYFCIESAKKLRQLIEEAKSMEAVTLDAEAVKIIICGAKSVDGSVHFINGDGGFGVMAGEFKTEWLTGRQRSRYMHVRDQLERQRFITPKGGGLYYVTERGYVVGDFLAAARHSPDQPFCGDVKLPAPAKSTEAGTTYNIVNSHVGQLTHSGSNIQNSKGGDP